MLFALVHLASAGVLINEILYDPSGTDGTNEWLELCNAGPDAVDLTGYTVEAGGSTFGLVYTFASGAMDVGDHLLVGATSTDYPYVFDSSFQNAGDVTDGVRIKDATGAVVDTILYDSPNDNALPGDNDDTTVTPAVDVAEGHSLGRWPDCTDTNQPGVDFADYATPSPGVANPDPSTGGDTGDTGGGDTGTGTTADCAGSESVTINEFQVATGLEYVELYNKGASSVNLAGWELRYGSSSYKTPIAFPDGSVLDAGGYFVVGSETADYIDWSTSIDLGNSNGAIQLQCDGAAVDSVAYGDDVSSWIDDATTDGAAYAPVPSSDASTSRWNDGLDTNVCASDFTTLTPTPGATNGTTCAPTCNADGASGLKINEFLSNPAHTDDGFEWVEIYNSGSTTVELDDFVLEAGTQSFSPEYTFPGCVTIDPGGYVVIGGADVPEADYTTSGISLGNGTSSGDGIRLLDCEGNLIDEVYYGKGAPESSFSDGVSTAWAESVSAPSEGSSLGRTTDGVDTDGIDDWRAFTSPTPGSANVDNATTDTGTGSPGGGCGGSHGDSSSGHGGCATVPFDVGVGPLAALAFVFRRRRA